MAEMASNNRVDITRLIFIPSVITLAVTLLRLIGELQHWSPVLFNPAAGGGGAIMGITWLVLIFGIYFALKLFNAGEGPARIGKASSCKIRVIKTRILPVNDSMPPQFSNSAVRCAAFFNLATLKVQIFTECGRSVSAGGDFSCRKTN